MRRESHHHLGIRHIRLERQTALELRGDPFGGAEIDVDDGDASARLRQCVRDAAADAVSGSCDDGDLVCERFHARPPLMLARISAAGDGNRLNRRLINHVQDRGEFGKIGGVNRAHDDDVAHTRHRLAGMVPSGLTRAQCIHQH